MNRTVHISAFAKKELPTALVILTLNSMLLSYLLFGNRYFQSLPVFAWASLATATAMGLAFLMYGFVVVSLRERFSEDHQLIRRLILSIAIVFLLSAVYLSLLLAFFDNIHFLGYSYYENDFGKTYVTSMLVNLFLIFLIEGIYGFRNYEFITKETELLKKEYVQSQLLSLKSQINPHFLFNGLNTLSSLIQEDADAAEEFLDHMSKVYRYLLRNNDEQLVSLGTELQFIRSYYYLLKARYGTGIDLNVQIGKQDHETLIPPLTLQMMMENILQENVIAKAKPLTITIRTENKYLIFENIVQPRVNSLMAEEDLLENISNKFRLLGEDALSISIENGVRTVMLPLITEKQIAEA